MFTYKKAARTISSMMKQFIQYIKVKVARIRLPSVGFRSMIPVFGSQPAGDVSHKPGGRLALLSAGPAVTLATLKKGAANFAAW